MYNHLSIESTGPVEKLGSEMLAQKHCKYTIILNFEKKKKIQETFLVLPID